MKKLPLTVILVARDEEVHLERCLKNIVPHTDHVIVVEWGSVDRTVEIAKRFGANVVHHEFINQADQFNWALDHISVETEWILRLDGDEYCTEELWTEIGDRIESASPEITGFYMKRRAYFMGRWMRHGGHYPAWFLRVFRKGKAKYEEREMDEHLVLLKGAPGFLRNDFVDWNLKGLADWTAKHNGYSTREVRARLREAEEGIDITGSAGQAARKKWLKQHVYGRLPLFIRPFLYFTYRYFFRLGFLDGVPGFVFHVLQGFWHQFLIDAKLYEIRRRKEA